LDDRTGSASGVYWTVSMHKLILVELLYAHFSHPNENSPLLHILCRWDLKLLIDGAQTTEFSSGNSRNLKSKLVLVIGLIPVVLVLVISIVDRVYDAGIDAKACARKSSTSTSTGKLLYLSTYHTQAFI